MQIEDPSSQAQIRAAEKLTSQDNSGRPKEPEQETTAQIDEEEDDDDEVGGSPKFGESQWVMYP